VTIVRERRCLVAFAALLLLAAACGDDDDDDDATATSPATTAASAASPTSRAASPPADASPRVVDTATVASPVASPPPPTAPPDASPGAAGGYTHLDMWEVDVQALGGVEAGPDGRLYVSDAARDRVLIFNPDGSEAGTIAVASDAPPLNGLNDVAVAPDGAIYVLDVDGHRVVAHAPDGTLVTAWGGMTGEEPGRFVDPRGIAVDVDGFVYVAENLYGYSARVQKFTAGGEFVAQWTRAGDDLFPFEPRSIESGPGGIYVLALGDGDVAPAILRFDSDGTLLGEPLAFGGEDDLVPGAFAVGPNGDLFVADPFRRIVARVSPAGAILARLDIVGPSDQRGELIEVAAGGEGRVYVVDGFRKLVEVFGPATGVGPGPAEPALMLGPDRGTCETSVHGLGTGFAPFSEVTLLAGPAAGTAAVPIARTAVAADGTFGIDLQPEDLVVDCAGLEITLNGAAFEVVARAGDDTSATAMFTLYSAARAPRLTVSPEDGGCDTAVSAAGANFEPGTTVVIRSHSALDNAVTTLVTGVPVTDDGAFTVDLPLDAATGCPNPPDDEDAFQITAATERGATVAEATYPSASGVFRFSEP
jgi:DNA-binding beta-propeller fold protein YncE